MANPAHVSADAELEIHENVSLISSDKIDGTAVFNVEREKIGNVHNFMVDKVSGRVVYVVVSFGGFLGLGQDYFPLPWEKLA